MGQGGLQVLVAGIGVMLYLMLPFTHMLSSQYLLPLSSLLVCPSSSFIHPSFFFQVQSLPALSSIITVLHRVMWIGLGNECVLYITVYDY